MFDEGFFRDTLTPLLAIWGALVGTIGAVLGILGYQLRRRSHRVQLALRVRAARELSDGELVEITLLVRISNNSHFDVTISSIGLCVRHRWYSRLEKIPFFPGHDHLRDKVLPARIPARDQKEFRFPLRKQWFFAYSSPTIETVSKARCVFVETSGGNAFYGRGPGFASFVKSATDVDPASLRHWEK